MSDVFRVIALIAGFNEADVIHHVVSDLVEQGIEVYFLDDGSTDGTAEIVESFLGSGVISVERRPPGIEFSWRDILRRKEQLSLELDADWFIHHDADEFREAPWNGMVLRDAIRQVDRCGYNAIDFRLLNFWPTDDTYVPGSDVRESLRYYGPAAGWDRLQLKCWKKGPTQVSLASSAGHEVQFEGRSIFPLRFLLRHYPIRSQAHGQRKVFRERRPRFTEEERRSGWHIQYDQLPEDYRFTRRASDLTKFDPVAIRVELTLEHREVAVLSAAILDCQQQASTLRSDLAGVREQLELRNTELRSRTREYERVVSDLAGVRELLELRTIELRSRTRECERVTSDLATARAEAADTRLSLERERLDADRDRHILSTELRARTTDLAAHQQYLRDVMSSRSWRLTAPLRALQRLLRGG